MDPMEPDGPEARVLNSERVIFFFFCLALTASLRLGKAATGAAAVALSFSSSSARSASAAHDPMVLLLPQGFMEGILWGKLTKICVCMQRKEMG